MKIAGQFPFASGGEAVALHLEIPVPDFKGPEFEREAHDFYRGAAIAFVDVLRDYAPQGFTDAVLGELCWRRASILKVRG